ncbi:arf-GAP domain and FG repeat-containing protein 1-like [Uloborus diversus]|uniref:arf-GAP domain and FG repeat-containing protein 1-like n=1 Tax=Uloborus diversus TaxID=327109 RepID=UPI00240A35AF|nr:arf-GAP domain and FG repeat-containing protein 1-like [Uloborus diversus]
MAAREKTRDELDMKTLRELAALPANKYCFDCGQRGPTYVNVTIGAFVCSSCGGLLRGLNPPHRVKSLTVCSFTEVEMDRIKSRGNEYCHHIWLGKYDPKCFESDVSSPEKRKQFMIQKYEDKKYYVDPREAIKKMKPRAPAVPSNNSVTQSKSHTVIPNRQALELQKSGGLPQALSSGNIAVNSSPDLFKDFGDPFKESKQDNSGASFADFSSAFGDDNSNASAAISGQINTSSTVSSSSPVISSSGLQSVSSHKKPAPPPPDRYAALADLDNQLHQQQTPDIPNTIPSAIVTSAASVFWPTVTPAISAGVFAPVAPNPFGHTATTWSQPALTCAPNPFQAQPASGNVIVLQNQNANGLPTAIGTNPSLSNGGVSAACWPGSSSQIWGSSFTNGQSVQNKSAVVGDGYNPWGQSFATSSANPFLGGSFASNPPGDASRTNSGKNPFL